MTDRPRSPAVLLRWLGGSAAKAQDRTVLAWQQYVRHPDAARAPLALLVEAYDVCDRLRLALVGTRAEMGLLGEMTEEIAARMGKAPQLVVEGVGQVVRHGKSKRERWDVDQLAPVVAVTLGARIADTPGVVATEDGEPHPPSEIARRAAAEAVWAMVALCGMTPSQGWRTGPLKALGIDPADYRDSEFGGWTLEIARGVVDGASAAQDEPSRLPPLAVVDDRSDEDRSAGL